MKSFNHAEKWEQFYQLQTIKQALNSCAEPVALPGALLDSVGTFAEIDLTYAVHHLQKEHKKLNFS